MKFLKTYDAAHKVDPYITEKSFARMAKDNRRCQCGNHVWRYGECGLCFSCTTGEHDSSDDYEIGEEYFD